MTFYLKRVIFEISRVGVLGASHAVCQAVGRVRTEEAAGGKPRTEEEAAGGKPRTEEEAAVGRVRTEEEAADGKARTEEAAAGRVRTEEEAAVGRVRTEEAAGGRVRTEEAAVGKARTEEEAADGKARTEEEAADGKARPEEKVAGGRCGIDGETENWRIFMDRLAAQGIRSVWAGEERIVPAMCGREGTPPGEARTSEDIGKGAGAGREGTLWITDSPALARRHAERGEPVLGYLHRANMGEDFSAVRFLAERVTETDADYLDKTYRRCVGIPWEILETERCLLRETTQEDVDAFYEIYAEPSVTAYMENLFPEKERELAYTRDYIKNIYHFWGYGIWTVCDKRTGRVIGRAGFDRREGYEDPEMGFLIGVPWQGQGLATEVCRAILSYGEQELGFTEVIAFATPENKVSCHILAGLGFWQEQETQVSGRMFLLWRRGGQV